MAEGNRRLTVAAIEIFRHYGAGVGIWKKSLKDGKYHISRKPSIM